MNAVDYADCARHGAEFLDEHIPGWAARIDLATLDLANYCACVLGQLGGYDVMKREFGLNRDAAVALGFLLPGVASPASAHWARLEAAWADEILDRREAVQVAP